MSKIYEIVYSEKSYEDIKEIYYYILVELNAPESARKIIFEIYSKIEKLDYMLHKFKIIDWEPWKSMSVHQMVVNNYNILYLIEE